jgi:hypothetical protein
MSSGFIVEFVTVLFFVARQEYSINAIFQGSKVFEQGINGNIAGKAC